MESRASPTCTTGPPERERLTHATSAGSPTALAFDVRLSGGKGFSYHAGRSRRATHALPTASVPIRTSRRSSRPAPSAGIPLDAELAFRVSSSTSQLLFRELRKRGIRTRDTRLNGPLLYPLELACRESARRWLAVHAVPNPSVEPRASRDPEPDPLPRHRHGQPVDDQTRSHASGRMPVPKVGTPKRRGPGGQVPTGASWEDLPGALPRSSRPHGTEGLARHTFTQPRKIAADRMRAGRRGIRGRR